jgi:hypothetical protein
MDTGLIHNGSIALNRGETLRVRDAAGRYLGVVSGAVWLTQEDDTRDHVVRAGEHFRFDRGGLALVRPIDGMVKLVLEDGLVAERKAEPQVISVTRDVWLAYSPELERRARRLRAEAIGQAIGLTLAALAYGLTMLWGQIARAFSAVIRALHTARQLPSLGDSTVHDIGLHRDRIIRIANTLAR